jgi:hypothetical protein
VRPTVWATSSRDNPERRSEKATSSPTVGMTIWASGFVKQKPTCRRTSLVRVAVSSPLTVTVPSLGTTSPLSSRANVDLPDPLAPITPILRSGRRRSTASSTVASP